MKIELSEKERQNLATFLQRVQLSGAEVPAYVEIVAALNKPFQEKLDTNGKNNQPQQSEAD